MKLLFSEHKSDYSNYLFPYVIWAIPEKHETPAQIFSRGFLPSSHNLDLFYMCRQVRIQLDSFELSSENRRIIKKGSGISFNLIPIDKFEYTQNRKEFYKQYTDIKFGKDVMTYDRLDALFNSKIINHVLIFIDTQSEKEVGTATLYIEDNFLIYYYYAFYDLSYYSRNLGIYMMTRAVEFFSKKQFNFIYLGTCYSKNALYKTQFAGAEFFNGFHWSNNLNELKYLIKKDKDVIKKHLLETEEFREKFYEGNLAEIINKSVFTI